MTVFIGADHRGFQLKDILTSYLQEKNIRVEDMGSYSYDPADDFPPYAQRVAEAVLQQPETNLGIVICGSGVGVSMAANRYKGVYCALGFDADQIKKSRQHDHINVLALGADYITKEKAIQLVDTFLETSKSGVEKYAKRLRMIDNTDDRSEA